MKLTEQQLAELGKGENLACKTESMDGLKCWLMVIPFKIRPETGMPTLDAPSEPWRFRVWHFGIPVDFDYFNYDLHPEYVTDFSNEVVGTVEQVEQLIALVINSPDALADPRDCKCPV